MKKKICLGAAEPPIHPQHFEVMRDFENWQLTDLYVSHPDIVKLDATTMDEIKDDYLEHIYASHLLEHISHKEVPQVLRLWHNKLKKDGILTLNVPDLEWACRQVIRHENMQPLQSDVYSTFEGDRGLQSIFYGTHAHDGEIHKSGFTKTSLKNLLEKVGFKDVNISQIYEGHDMGCLFSFCVK